MILPAEKLPQKIRFLIRYGISGATGAFIQITTDMLAVDVFGAHYQVGVVVGFCIAVTVSFLLQKYWTFRDGGREHLEIQLISYVLIAIGSLVANVLLMYVFVEQFELFYLVAQILTIGIVVGLSFLLNNFITFRHSTERIR